MKTNVIITVDAKPSAYEANLAQLAGFEEFIKSKNGAFECPKTKRTYQDEQIGSINLVPCTDGCVYYIRTAEGSIGILFEVLPEEYSDAA